MTEIGGLPTQTQGARMSVGQVADLFAITVRTLHHYDEIGLVVPGERSPAGYRVYTHDDLARLSTVVVYRRLGFCLEEVAQLLADPSSVRDHLTRQRAAVMTRLEELRELVTAIDHALEKDMSNQQMTTQDVKELFGDGFSEEYQAQAQERWGDTSAWKQSQARTSTYTKADWEQVKAEGDAINDAFVAALRSGEPATSEAAMDAAEAHREHIEARFYDLDHRFHRGLGEMYVTDERFTKTYEDLAPGLARYVRDAIAANADRHGA